jgi:hypothetical protein
MQNLQLRSAAQLELLAHTTFHAPPDGVLLSWQSVAPQNTWLQLGQFVNGQAVATAACAQ